MGTLRSDFGSDLYAAATGGDHDATDRTKKAHQGLSWPRRMMLPLGPPADGTRFPDCGRCAIARVATTEQCVPCAAETLSFINEPRCEVCSGPGVGPCRNSICGWEDRGWGVARCMARLDARAYDFINPYKNREDGRLAEPWPRILGRLLHHHIAVAFRPAIYDLIVPMPFYQQRPRDRHMLAAFWCARESDAVGALPWDDPADLAFFQSAPLPERAVEAGGWRARWDRSAALPGLLELRHPDRIVGKHVLIVDDTFTTGIGLTRVARWLKLHGAASVDGAAVFRAVY